MQKKIYILVSEILGLSIDKINNNLEMENTETWDSLRHMELIGSIEESFNIELQVDEIVRMRSLKEIIKILEERELDGI